LAVAVLGLLLAGLWTFAVRTGRPTRPVVTACDQQVVIDSQTRAAAGLATWPDGTLGVVDEGDNYAFVGSGADQGVATTVGTLSDPIKSAVDVTRISGLHLPFNYAAGGPVLDDPADNSWLVFYHAERWPEGDATRYYSSIGLAISTDRGRSWRDLGEIIRPHVPYAEVASQPVEVGAGPYIEVGGYVYVYFRDEIGPRQTSQLSVARAPVAAVLASSRAGRTIAWHDYYDGSWEQPALGGLASPLEPDNPQTRWFDVLFDPRLGRYVLAAATNDGIGVNLYAAFSTDGIHWSGRQRLTDDHAENLYPTLVWAQPSGHASDYQMYLYYTVAPLDGPRWPTAVLDRMTIEDGGSCRL
jgi:hypothetical protein